MAVRTVSPLARSIGASAQIGRSERDRLQKAVRDLEKGLADYAKTQQRRTSQKGRWKVLRKIGEGLTTIGALTGNPVLAGIGLAVTSGGGAGEGVMSATQVKGAEGIKTGAADPLSNLLFVGKTARDVGSGAEEYKGSQVGAFQSQYEQDVVDIGFSVIKSMVGAGQAGTFGGTPYTPAVPGVEGAGDVAAVAAQEAGGTGIQGFLTKPITPYGPPPVDGTAMEKYLYESRKMATPSYGSLLPGGVSPYEQQVFGEPLSALGTKIRGSIGSWLPKPRLQEKSAGRQFFNNPFEGLKKLYDPNAGFDYLGAGGQ